jgi:hypothetical protein
VSTLKIVALVLVLGAIAGALLVLWSVRRRRDESATKTRYNMIGTVCLLAVVPVQFVLEARLTILPYVLLLAALLGSGAFLVWKAR